MKDFLTQMLDHIKDHKEAYANWSNEEIVNAWMKMENWIKFDNKEIPEPLSGQSGGWFWIVQRSVHGNKMSPAWWTGSKFSGYNMDIITEFKRMNFPDMPNTI